MGRYRIAAVLLAGIGLFAATTATAQERHEWREPPHRFHRHGPPPPPPHRYYRPPPVVMAPPAPRYYAPPVVVQQPGITITIPIR